MPGPSTAWDMTGAAPVTPGPAAGAVTTALVIDTLGAVVGPPAVTGIAVGLGGVVPESFDGTDPEIGALPVWFFSASDELNARVPRMPRANERTTPVRVDTIWLLVHHGTPRSFF